MQEQHPLSPEERRKKLAAETAAYGPQVAEKAQKETTAWDIVKRIAIGVYNDGFIHAGNLAYLALLALFPFFITAAMPSSVWPNSRATAAATITNGKMERSAR